MISPRPIPYVFFFFVFFFFVFFFFCFFFYVFFFLLFFFVLVFFFFLLFWVPVSFRPLVPPVFLLLPLLLLLSFPFFGGDRRDTARTQHPVEMLRDGQLDVL